MSQTIRMAMTTVTPMATPTANPCHRSRHFWDAGSCFCPPMFADRSSRIAP